MSEIHEPARLERSCAVIASALSDGRRDGVRILTGENRSFGLSISTKTVHVPFPALVPSWTLRAMTCAVGLQCAPSKDQVSLVRLDALTGRELDALTIVEGSVAAAWLRCRAPGLAGDLDRLLPDLPDPSPDLGPDEMVEQALTMARRGAIGLPPPLLGRLRSGGGGRHWLAPGRRLFGRMPWTTSRRARERIWSVPYGGEGGVRNSTESGPSHPDDLEEVSVDRRVGIPYPEWNMWTGRFLVDHVSVLEQAHPTGTAGSVVSPPQIRRWFQAPTTRVFQDRLEDGSELDVDQYVHYAADLAAGMAIPARLFRDLLPGARDVATALLLDGSASVDAANGSLFRLELACADALSKAMAHAGERHGIFVFSGNTRHRVHVRCLKDFSDRHRSLPGSAGLTAGGYTRLGAPIRHLTDRLIGQRVARRLLIVIGDGLISDEGYEGRYAWADVAHAVEEAYEADVIVFYIGVGAPRVDPLPEVFGPRRSKRISRVDELPRVLAQVHDHLVAA